MLMSRPVYSCTIDLDAYGNLVDADTGEAVTARGIPGLLAQVVAVPEDATDIFVFVHGWQNSPSRAASAAIRLQEGIDECYRVHREDYPALTQFRGYYVVVRWPSRSNPFPWGYRRIRDRAHAMTTNGHAEFVLAHLLGYLNEIRNVPQSLPPTLRAKDGQYLHCVGHSFGGRFLAEAVMLAAEPTAPTLSWPWGDTERYPYSIDTLVVFQMAARPDDFARRFAALLYRAPISGPIVLTFSRFDRALRRWHRITEGVSGIGASGARAPAEEIQTIALPHIGQSLELTLDKRIINVDSSWRYRHGRFLRPEGAHSDIWYEESFNLLLLLAAAAR